MNSIPPRSGLESDESAKLSIRPIVVRPFDAETFQAVANHVRSARESHERSGAPYHDPPRSDGMKFNRWCMHNPPFLRDLHAAPWFREVASEVFGRRVKPSYCFLSMYGPDGVCPTHTDRPQCQFTIDMLVGGGEGWPIYIDGSPYALTPGEAVCYSGTQQPHYRKPMPEDSRAVSADLVFFHWVLADWKGPLD